MSHRFRYQEDGSLLVIVFEGLISLDEERQAIEEVSQDPDFKPNAQILVDRREARMEAEPKDVGAQVELAKKLFPPRTGKPKMALLVGSDYDFAMARMVEMTASDNVAHDIYVFRELDEACHWLSVEPQQINWP